MRGQFAHFDIHGNAFDWYATSREALRDVRLLLDQEDYTSARELQLIHFDENRTMHLAMDGDALVRVAAALSAPAIS